jgi:mercuric ion binding protein
MRTSLLVLALAASSSLLAGEPPTLPLAANTVANATNRFIVSGMHCEGCAQGITSELTRAPGVAFAKVSFTNKLAIVGYDTNRTSAKALRKVVRTAGYEAKPAKP